jgi:hypothetical protein
MKLHKNGGRGNSHCASCEKLLDMDDHRFSKMVYKKADSCSIQNVNGIEFRYFLCALCIYHDGDICLTSFLTKVECNRVRECVKCIPLIGILYGLPKDVVFYIWSILCGLGSRCCMVEHETGHFDRYLSEGTGCTIF